MLFCISVKPFLLGIQSCFLFPGSHTKAKTKRRRWGPRKRKAGVFGGRFLSGWALAQRKFKLDYIRSLGIIQCDLCRCLLPGEMGQNKPSSSQVALTGSCPRAVLLMLEGEQ